MRHDDDHLASSDGSATGKPGRFGATQPGGPGPGPGFKFGVSGDRPGPGRGTATLAATVAGPLLKYRNIIFIFSMTIRHEK